MSVLIELRAEQCVEAKRFDAPAATFRRVADIHHDTDNRAGLALGQEMIAKQLPEYLEQFGADPEKVRAKIERMRHDWFAYEGKADEARPSLIEGGAGWRPLKQQLLKGLESITGVVQVRLEQTLNQTAEDQGPSPRPQADLSLKLPAITRTRLGDQMLGGLIIAFVPLKVEDQQQHPTQIHLVRNDPTKDEL
tara:strand:+ start:224 stop:802 length:579 start_codon:yes stop_codon:yes gene_type:complete